MPGTGLLRLPNLHRHCRSRRWSLRLRMDHDRLLDALTVGFPLRIAPEVVLITNAEVILLLLRDDEVAEPVVNGQVRYVAVGDRVVNLDLAVGRHADGAFLRQDSVGVVRAAALTAEV